MVAGACNQDHKSKVLAESATLKTLEEKLDWLSTLENSESASATRGQSCLVMEVELPKSMVKDAPSQNWKCSTCQKLHKLCGTCKRRHDAETRYSPSEGELLAIVFGIHQCRMFLLGCQKIFVARDHLPLIPILGDKVLDQIQNPRLHTLKEKTLRINSTALHVPGKNTWAQMLLPGIPVGRRLIVWWSHQPLSPNLRWSGGEWPE